MDSISFLNKKYTSIHNTIPLANSRSRSSRTFMPTISANLSHTHTHNNVVNDNHINQIAQTNVQPGVNHCLQHPQQIIRHLCLDCIELLCSQCICDHISVHKQNNSYPNIKTLKQVRQQVNTKLQSIVEFMSADKNNPKNMANSAQIVRKQSIEKIDALKRQLMTVVQQWINKLKNAIINNVGCEEIKIIKNQMHALHQQVNQLVSSISSANASVYDVKKAYQIDADRLLKCYTQMAAKYASLIQNMRIQVKIDANKFIQSIQETVSLKLNQQSKKQINQIQQQKIVNYEVQNNKIQTKDKQIQNQTENQAELLYSMISGTNTLRIFNPSKIQQGIKSYKLQGVSCYPLNSICLLQESMIVISGGIIADTRKSDVIQVYDYGNSCLIRETKLFRGRSSHKTIVHNGKIIIIGGFYSDNQQCRQIQIFSVQGLQVSQSKCKWGGPNLCIKLKDSIFKVTVSGVQQMDLQTYKWKQITTQVPFALSKGMQISYCRIKNNYQIIVFGDDKFYYIWNDSSRKFEIFESSLSKPVLCSAYYNGGTYGWTQNGKTNIFLFNEPKWSIVF